jgi:hypothetical protein
MALSKTSTKILDNKTANASSSTTASECTAVDLSSAIQMAIDVEMTFNASATLGATVKVYASDDNINWDSSTHPYDQFDVAVSAGNAVKVHFAILPAPKYIRVLVTNLDTTYSITAISVYSIPQIASDPS